jgi:hypothetical protein
VPRCSTGDQALLPLAHRVRDEVIGIKIACPGEFLPIGDGHPTSFWLLYHAGCLPLSGAQPGKSGLRLL